MSIYNLDAFGIEHVLLGVYCWEWLISLDFDWQYLSGKKRFRWPMVFYFLNRYILLAVLIGMIVALDVRTEINCEALYNFNQYVGNLVPALVCINFAIRTMAVWTFRWYIVAPLTLLVLGHLSLLMQRTFYWVVWNQYDCGSVKQTVKPAIFVAALIYRMCFDFILLCLTGYKLHVHMSPIGFSGSRLARLIFHDGLLYFVLTFVLNFIATMLVVLNITTLMSTLVTYPACIVSTIVACRAVRRLANYTCIGTDVYQMAILPGQHVLAAALSPPSTSPAE